MAVKKKNPLLDDDDDDVIIPVEAPAAKPPAKGKSKGKAKKAPPPPPPTHKSGGAAVKSYAQALQKQFGKDRAALLNATTMQADERVSTGVEVLDQYVLGNGGIPIGRMIEVFGDEGAGKTSFGYTMIASVQRAGGVGVWFVSPGEGGISEERASKIFGVDLNKLVVVYPETLEECFEQMKFVIGMHNPSTGPMVIVWDSIAAMTTEDGAGRAVGDRKVGDVPLIMSEELKKVIPMLKKHRAALYAINQIRTKIGVMFGPDTTTPGGKAPKYYASQRLQIMGGKAVKNSKGEHIAKIITLLAVKNRFGNPWRKARVRLDYATGFNNLWSTIWHAKTQKLIKCRAEGFAGPSHDGVAAYQEALAALGWNGKPPTPVLEEPDDDTEGDAPDDDDTDDDADDDDDQ